MDNQKVFVIIRTAICGFARLKKDGLVMDLAITREFLGWCSVINMGLLLLSSFLVITIRKTTVRMHGKMFNVDEKFLCQAYFTYLGQYKIAILVLNIVPYFALKIIG